MLLFRFFFEISNFWPSNAIGAQNMNEMVLTIGMIVNGCMHLCSDFIDAIHAAISSIPAYFIHSEFVRNCEQIYANKKLASIQKIKSKIYAWQEKAATYVKKQRKREQTIMFSSR